MTEKELKTLLLSLELPVAYDHFKKKVEPPFILFWNNDTTTFKADDKTHWKDNNYLVDLITDIKQPELETQLETIFDNNYIPYDKSEDFISSEQIYQIRYYI